MKEEKGCESRLSNSRTRDVKKRCATFWISSQQERGQRPRGEIRPCGLRKLPPTASALSTKEGQDYFRVRRGAEEWYLDQLRRGWLVRYLQAANLESPRQYQSGSFMQGLRQSISPPTSYNSSSRPSIMLRGVICRDQQSFPFEWSLWKDGSAH